MEKLVGGTGVDVQAAVDMAPDGVNSPARLYVGPDEDVRKPGESEHAWNARRKGGAEPASETATGG